MRLLIAAGLLTGLAGLAQQPSPRPSIVVPAQTRVVLAVTSPVWAKSVHLGDAIYAETAFPVAVNDAIAIPPGTYVKGRIDIMTLPALTSGHAEFRISFAEMIFAGGYVVELPDVAFATLNVLVSSRSDVLLDHGTEIEMVLEGPLTLDAAKVASAARQSKPPDTSKWKSATRCRPTPATPGTSDTVISGTPGTPGTPPTVIPGGPGMPPTVIPGTPATPGTSDTVIPGTSGSPAIPCPAPPSVAAQPVVHKEPFNLTGEVLVGGQKLAPGLYQAVWDGLGPVAGVEILRKGKAVATARAHVVGIAEGAGQVIPRTNPDGSVSLGLVQFTARTFALRFDVP